MVNSQKPKTVASFFLDLVTTANSDGCNIKIGGHLLLLSFLAFTCYATFKIAEKFDPIAFATAGVTILGGTAGAQKLKDSTEPQPPAQTTGE